MMIQQFDYSVNLTQSILWQYSQTNNLVGLINQKQSWYNVNQSTFWQDWYNNVFNLLTANSFGLSVWSYILNVPLYFQNEPEPSDKPIWGFNKYATPIVLSGTVSTGMDTVSGLSSTGSLSVGMRVSDGGVNIPAGTLIATIVDSHNITMTNNATGSGTESLSFTALTLENTYFNFGGVAGNGGGNFSTRDTIITLTEEEQRFLLRLRYFQLTTRGDVTDINAFLNYLVNSSDIGYTGTIYVLDGLNMTITYVFTTTDFPQYLLNAMLPPSAENPNGLDILPRPAGVGVNVHINYGKQWGFNAFDPAYPDYENTNQNFGNGNYLAPYI